MQGQVLAQNEYKSVSFSPRRYVPFAQNSFIIKNITTMKTAICNLFDRFLHIAASAKSFGYGMMRIAILIIFVWIGGLKFAHYEAEGIVPFVANSPFMSFFYAKDAPEYKGYKNKEGELKVENRAWHES